MENGMFIPPIHWDDETFLRMVEPYLTTDLERHLFARLSRSAAYDAVYEEGEYDTYPHEDLVSTLKERDDRIGELEAEVERLGEDYAREYVKNEELEYEVQSLNGKIGELNDTIADKEADNDSLDRELTAVKNKLARYE